MILYQPEITEFAFQPVPLKYWKNNPDGLPYESYPVNWHADYEMFYVVKGHGKFLLDTTAYAVSKGEIYVINPYRLHRMYSDGEQFEYYYFKVPGQLFKIAHLDMNGKQIKTNVTSPETIRLFENYISEFSKKDGTTVMRAVAASMYLLAYIIENYSYTAGDGNADPMADSGRYSKCSEVMVYINTHYKEKLSASVIADALGYNRSYLTREFRKHTGQTLTGYINMVRCVAAHDMLTSTKLPVSRVAAECGYNDVSHFNNIYKRFFGTTPAKAAAEGKMKSWIYKH